MRKIIIITAMTLMFTSKPAWAGPEKLAKIMGFGGACADCDLSKKNLSGARMNGVSFPRTNFTGTDLSNSKMIGSNFNRAVFRRADLSYVKANDSNFSWADFSGATLDNIKTKGSSFTRANFTGIKAKDAEFYSSNFSYAILLGASLIDAEFETCNLSFADLSKAKLRGSSFTRSDVSNANLEASDLSEASFDHVNFYGAKFGNAIVKNASFDEVYFAGADLSEVNGLTNSQLEKSCGDNNTKLPRGITLTDCSKVGWANDFTNLGNNRSYSFKFTMPDSQTEQIQQQVIEEVRKALMEGHESLREVGRTLSLAEINKPTIHFEWDNPAIGGADSEDHRSQRALYRTIRALARMEVRSNAAQNEIDLAIIRLEQAYELLRAEQTEQKLVGVEPQ